jgi:hypothetical protein
MMKQLRTLLGMVLSVTIPLITAGVWILNGAEAKTSQVAEYTRVEVHRLETKIDTKDAGIREDVRELRREMNDRADRSDSLMKELLREVRRRDR